MDLTDCEFSTESEVGVELKLIECFNMVWKSCFKLLSKYKCVVCHSTQNVLYSTQGINTFPE